MHEQVFPDFAVKQAMREVNMEREDDVVITSIQSDLLTRCMNVVLKGAVVSCVHNKRRYINERDIEYALQTTVYPISAVHSNQVGYLLDTRQMGVMCQLHITLVSEMMTRSGIEVGEIKISADILLVVQEAVERLIRGFFSFFKREGSGHGYGYRLFDQTMSQLTGDSSAANSTFTKWDAR